MHILSSIYKKINIIYQKIIYISSTKNIQKAVHISSYKSTTCPEYIYIIKFNKVTCFFYKKKHIYSIGLLQQATSVITIESTFVDFSLQHTRI
jgi:hypothetical protein